MLVHGIKTTLEKHVKNAFDNANIIDTRTVHYKVNKAYQTFFNAAKGLRLASRTYKYSV